MRRLWAAVVFWICSVFFLSSCQSGGAGPEEGSRDISPELVYSHSMELQYAQEFAVDFYEGGYALLTIEKNSRFLVIPQGKAVPEDLEADIVPLIQPVENIYLVASAAMDMFLALDALDYVRFCGIKPEGWYLEEIRTAMSEGKILYAGNYSAPDYERILAEQCGLAVENTMIYHTPEVKEQLERLGIPVLVDYSSYEKEPLGRTEWVKCYGLLTGRETEAEAAFQDQVRAFETVREDTADGSRENKTVAFFYFTANGAVNVRKSSDYLPKMIEMAGGNYVFSGLGDGDGASSTVTLQMEEFYKAAKDADYLIYNSTIDGELVSVDELLDRQELLGSFKAVQNGNVFCTTKNIYQSSMELGTIISDIHKILMGEEGMSYLYRLSGE